MINDIGQKPAYESSDLKSELENIKVYEHAKQQERKAAFWQVYSAMIGGLTANPNSGKQSFDDIASAALSSVDAGFKALDGDSDE